MLQLLTLRSRIMSSCNPFLAYRDHLGMFDKTSIWN